MYEFGTCGLIIESKNFAHLYSGVFIIDTTGLAGLSFLCTLIKPYSLPETLPVGIKLVVISLPYFLVFHIILNVVADGVFFFITE